MKVLKRRRNDRQETLKETKYPKKLTCDNCGSELEYDEADVYIGSFGCAFMKCPVCGNENIVDDESLDGLTIGQLEFPKHFAHCDGKESNAHMFTEDKILKSIDTCKKYLDSKDDEREVTSRIGDLCVTVEKDTYNDEYEIIVSNDFYITRISF